MKRIITIAFILILAAVLSAQEIPNPGFENWDGATGDLIDWFENNPPTGPQPVIQSLNSHSGMWSVGLRVVDLGGGIPLPPSISAGADGTGFPVTQRYEALNGWYEFTPLAGDFFNVAIQMWSGGIQGTQIGNGFFSTQSSTTDWTQFSVPVTYTESGTPDWCTIQIIIGIKLSIGGQAVVDDLSFGGASAVEQIEDLVPNKFELKQNYPNPFNPVTQIEYSIPEASFVQLKVYDVLGNEVTTLVNQEQSAGVYRADFNADVFSSGLYIARLNAGTFTGSIKMNLMK